MIKTQKYKVILERENCIGAAACTTVYPQRWQLAKDGKANLQGVKPNKTTQEIIIITKELEKMKQAVQNCPVNAIHIIDLKTNKKLCEDLNIISIEF